MTTERICYKKRKNLKRSSCVVDYETAPLVEAGSSAFRLNQNELCSVVLIITEEFLFLYFLLYVYVVTKTVRPD